MVLHSHGWGGSRETTASGAVAPYLAAGYGVLSFDQRGFGESTDDKANIMDPAKEGRDVVAVVDYVAELDWVARGSQDQKDARSEEQTSELQSLMRISYAVFCLKKKITHI